MAAICKWDWAVAEGKVFQTVYKTTFPANTSV